MHNGDEASISGMMFESDQAVDATVANGETHPQSWSFCPSEIELVWFLKNKIENVPLPPHKIQTVNHFYSFAPWELAEMYKMNGERENQWYFFTTRDGAPHNQYLPKRTVREKGLWRTSTSKKIQHEGKILAEFKSFVFYTDKKDRSRSKTNWIMHEYELVGTDAETRKRKRDSNFEMSEILVLCNIHHNNRREGGSSHDQKNCTASSSAAPVKNLIQGQNNIVMPPVASIKMAMNNQVHGLHPDFIRQVKTKLSQDHLYPTLPPVPPVTSNYEYLGRGDYRNRINSVIFDHYRTKLSEDLRPTMSLSPQTAHHLRREDQHLMPPNWMFPRYENKFENKILPPQGTKMAKAFPYTTMLSKDPYLTVPPPPPTAHHPWREDPYLSMPSPPRTAHYPLREDPYLTVRQPPRTAHYPLREDPYLTVRQPPRTAYYPGKEDPYLIMPPLPQTAHHPGREDRQGTPISIQMNYFHPAAITLPAVPTMPAAWIEHGATNYVQRDDLDRDFVRQQEAELSQGLNATMPMPPETEHLEDSGPTVHAVQDEAKHSEASDQTMPPEKHSEDSGPTVLPETELSEVSDPTAPQPTQNSRGPGREDQSNFTIDGEDNFIDYINRILDSETLPTAMSEIVFGFDGDYDSIDFINYIDSETVLPTPMSEIPSGFDGDYDKWFDIYDT
ncbi:hypothetical protein CRG98_021008 [Punica granatum]|uniref:NAC domain-containing protein n=1 Tax=Punica granatum TaxID=22663 RepID=A0A2I0JQQ0_PUNGR|nr:hypothetical protein CRG98_021008 [Punica granatum]